MLQVVSEARSTSLAVLASVAMFFVASAAAAAPCEVPDNGTGTADLPSYGCEYPGDTAGDRCVNRGAQGRFAVLNGRLSDNLPCGDRLSRRDRRLARGTDMLFQPNADSCRRQQLVP